MIASRKWVLTYQGVYLWCGAKARKIQQKAVCSPQKTESRPALIDQMLLCGRAYNTTSRLPTVHPSQNVSVHRPVILNASFVLCVHCPISMLSREPCSLFLQCSILLVQSLVLPPQQRPQTYSQQGSEEHKRRTHGLTLRIERPFVRWVKPRSQYRSTLPNNVQNNDPSTASRVRALVVGRPWKDIGYGWEDSTCSKENTGIACADALTGCEHDVASTANS